MVLYPNKLPESERVCSGICNPVRKRLYTIDMNTDEVYYIDLKEL